MNEDFPSTDGKALWQLAKAAAVRGSTTPISALDLAAWIDGKSDPQLTARIEAALLSDATLLETALAAGAAALDSDSAASERLAVRARALVAPTVRAARVGGASKASWFSGWQRRMEWAVVALALVVAAGAGLWIGGDVGDEVFKQTTMTSLFDDDAGLAGLLSPTEDL